MQKFTALLVGLLLAVVLCGPAVAADPGWFKRQPAAEQHAITNYAYNRSPVTTLPYPADAAEAGALETTIVAEGSVNTTAGAAIRARELRLIIKVGLIPELAAAFPEFVLIEGSFEAGWQIGTGIRKLFIRLHGPPNAGAGGSWHWQSLRWYNQGATVYFGAKVQQSPGAYLYFADSAGTTYHPARWFDAPCPFSGVTPPTGARIQVGVASGAQCAVYPYGYYDFASVYVDYPYLLETDVQPSSPLHPYSPSTDGTPTVVSPAPSDPGITSVESALEDFLESDDGDPLRSEIDWVEEGASDPMSSPATAPSPWETPPRTDWRRWCERSAPGTGLNSINQALDKFAAYQTFTAATLGSADLLYGNDDFLNVGGVQWKDIQGFGVRKIAAKHGWSNADEFDTAAALANPVTVTGPQGSRGRYRYYGASYSPNATYTPSEFASTGTCRRVVVVDTTQVGTDPRARGIITSFGDWTGARP